VDPAVVVDPGNWGCGSLRILLESRIHHGNVAGGVNGAGGASGIGMGVI
jgi:hypothetical protein